MNIGAALVWGVVATTVLTAISEAGVHAGFSRMSLPYLLGTVFTPDRRKAPLIGGVVHFLNGAIFAFAYALLFETLGVAAWWIGGLAGAVHAMFMLLFAEYLAGVHPRMATEQEGPQARPALQPPGFMALNYGGGTPLVALLAHVVYGAILGAFYPV